MLCLYENKAIITYAGRPSQSLTSLHTCLDLSPLLVLRVRQDIMHQVLPLQHDWPTSNNLEIKADDRKPSQVNLRVSALWRQSLSLQDYAGSASSTFTNPLRPGTSASPCLVAFPHHASEPNNFLVLAHNRFRSHLRNSAEREYRPVNCLLCLELRCDAAACKEQDVQCHCPSMLSHRGLPSSFFPFIPSSEQLQHNSSLSASALPMFYLCENNAGNDLLRFYRRETAEIPMKTQKTSNLKQVSSSSIVRQLYRRFHWIRTRTTRLSIRTYTEVILRGI